MIKFGQKFKSGEMKGKLLLTSDLHFMHTNVLKFCKETRPWENVDDMTEGLIEHWNSVVDPEDEVLDLGDMFFCNKDKIAEILPRLNGNITHLYGNHSKTLRNQFNINAYDYLEFIYDKTHIVACHFPLRSWNRQHYGSIHIFGHEHGKLEGIGRSMDVGWDAHGRMLNIEEVIDTLKNKQIVVEGGH